MKYRLQCPDAVDIHDSQKQSSSTGEEKTSLSGIKRKDREISPDFDDLQDPRPKHHEILPSVPVAVDAHNSLKQSSSTTAEQTTSLSGNKRKDREISPDSDRLLDDARRPKRRAAEATRPSPSSVLDADHILDSKRLVRCSSTAVDATSSSSISLLVPGLHPLKQRSPSSLLDADHIHERLKQHSSKASTTVEATRPSLVFLLLSDPIHHSNRLKRSSAARCPSNLMTNNIDDLPEAVLLEILCRLPSYKYVSQCKCVSKRWCTLMSDRCFFLPFLRLQGGSNQMVRSLINNRGEEFLTTMSSSLKVLAPLFQRLMRFHLLEKEPVVVTTYSDLVLCCASQVYQRDYYICNLRTYQWVALPPPPDVHASIPVGFICDLPYYKWKEGDHNQKEDKYIQVNCEYRGRVVRILSCHGELVSKFKVQIFSTETGEWTQSIVLIPSIVLAYSISPRVSHPYNGVLYWLSRNGDFLIGIDPFKITDSKTTSLPSDTGGDDTIDEYKCRFIKIGHPEARPKEQKLYFLGEHRGCLQLCCHDHKKFVSVWELNEEDTLEGAGEFCLQDRGVKYELDRDMIPGVHVVLRPLGFDPNNDGSLYMEIGPRFRLQRGENTMRSDRFMYNKRTEKWSKIAEKIPLPTGSVYRQVGLPCWPTPLPRQHSSIVGSRPSVFQAPSHSS